jgi:hypothetical protein
MEDPEAAPASTTSRPGCLRVVGLWLAIPSYLIILLFLLTFQKRNPEDGMLVGMLMMFELPLWAGIGGYWAGTLPAAQLGRGVLAVAWLSLVAAAFASFLSLEIMGTDPNWLGVVPALLPLVALGFGKWAGGIDAAAERRKPLLGFAAAALALFALFAFGLTQDIRRTAQGEAESRAELARQQAEFERLLRSPPSLDALLPYLNEEGQHERVIAAIGRTPTRQADAIRLLGAGDRIDSNLFQLHHFNLQADAALCAAYRSAFDRMVDRLHLTEGVHPGDLSYHRDSYVWLSENGCDLTASFRRAAERMRRFNDERIRMQAEDFESMANGVVPPLR